MWAEKKNSSLKTETISTMAYRLDNPSKLKGVTCTKIWYPLSPDCDLKLLSAPKGKTGMDCIVQPPNQARASFDFKGVVEVESAQLKCVVTEDMVRPVLSRCGVPIQGGEVALGASTEEFSSLTGETEVQHRANNDTNVAYLSAPP